MTSTPVAPLSGPLPEEAQLREAPLVRVIAQIKFPTILSIPEQDTRHLPDLRTRTKF